MKNTVWDRIPAILVFLLFSAGITYGQELKVKDPSVSSVYLQTDRSVYNSGETIFFEAFILNDLSDTYKSGKDTLLVALVDEDGLEVASDAIPVNGFSTQGSLELSRYLNAGNYVLVAGTVKMKDISPGKIFSRILEIHDPKSLSAKAIIKLDRTEYKPGESLKADVLFTGKNNETASASYSFSLSGTGGVLSGGKSRSGKDGHSVIELALPQFKAEETLTLNISGSVKGAGIDAGIIVPTAQNSKEEVAYGKSPGASPDNLVIILTTDKKEYGKSEEVTGFVSVTGQNGKPLFANLSVGASVYIPEYFPLVKDNIITCSNLQSHDNGMDEVWWGILGQKNNNIKSARNNVPDNGMLLNADLVMYFGKALSAITHLPGNCFAVEGKNDIKKIQRKQAAKQKEGQTGYSADRDIYDIINRIRPFQLVDNKIMFSNVGNYSVNFQGGALIVIDGVKRGTDASILKNIPVTDIARVTATTSPSELQRYSAMNSSGLVEIVTKKGNAAAGKAARDVQKAGNALFWKPDLSTDTSGKAKFSYRNNDESQEVILTVEGITSDGLTGSSSLIYRVK